MDEPPLSVSCLLYSLFRPPLSVGQSPIYDRKIHHSVLAVNHNLRHRDIFFEDLFQSNVVRKRQGIILAIGGLAMGLPQGILDGLPAPGWIDGPAVGLHGREDLRSHPVGEVVPRRNDKSQIVLRRIRQDSRQVGFGGIRNLFSVKGLRLTGRRS